MDPFTKRTTVEVGEHRATTTTTHVSCPSRGCVSITHHAAPSHCCLCHLNMHDTPPARSPATWHASITRHVASSNCSLRLRRLSMPAQHIATFSSIAACAAHASPPPPTPAMHCAFRRDSELAQLQTCADPFQSMRSMPVTYTSAAMRASSTISLANGPPLIVGHDCLATCT